MPCAYDLNRIILSAGYLNAIFSEHYCPLAYMGAHICMLRNDFEMDQACCDVVIVA